VSVIADPANVNGEKYRDNPPDYKGSVMVQDPAVADAQRRARLAGILDGMSRTLAACTQADHCIDALLAAADSIQQIDSLPADSIEALRARVVDLRTTYYNDPVMSRLTERMVDVLHAFMPPPPDLDPLPPLGPPVAVVIPPRPPWPPVPPNEFFSPIIVDPQRRVVRWVFNDQTLTVVRLYGAVDAQGNGNDLQTYTPEGDPPAYCGPKAAQNALLYFGFTVSEKYLMDNYLPTHPVPFSSNRYTLPSSLATGLARFFANESPPGEAEVDVLHLSHQTNDDIVAFLRYGYPVLALVDGGYHWIVVMGHDASTDTWWVLDNYDSTTRHGLDMNFSSGETVLSWFNADGSYQPGSIIVFGPRGDIDTRCPRHQRCCAGDAKRCDRCVAPGTTCGNCPEGQKCCGPVTAAGCLTCVPRSTVCKVCPAGWYCCDSEATGCTTCRAPGHQCP
jgi:hypothetical protein